MDAQIISLQDWFETPPGRYLQAWERAQFDAAVADIFGYHALQLGLPHLPTLQNNRMPHRWVADSSLLEKGLAKGLVPAARGLLAQDSAMQADVRGAAPAAAANNKTPTTALVTDFAALPFAANSLDLVVLPHALEFGADPHATLREVERVLVPEGRVVISGLNPASLWGLRQRRAQVYRRAGMGELFLPPGGDLIGYWRLRDWLRLLSFEVETGKFGCYRPSVSSDKWLGRFDWMDAAGARWWPIFGAVYFVVAVKKVRGMRLIGPAWKAAPVRQTAPVSLAGRSNGSPMSGTSRSNCETACYNKESINVNKHVA